MFGENGVDDGAPTFSAGPTGTGLPPNVRSPVMSSTTAGRRLVTPRSGHLKSIQFTMLSAIKDYCNRVVCLLKTHSFSLFQLFLTGVV